MSIKFSSLKNEFRLEAELEIARPIEEVFKFFSEAENLEELTPPLLSFSIATPTPIEMKRGVTIDYKLRVRGLPLKWTSLISEWSPPHLFTDEQLRGPYRYWIHQHIFESNGSGTLVKDFVRYQVFGGTFVHAIFVKPDLEKIFRYRQKRLQELFQ